MEIIVNRNTVLPDMNGTLTEAIRSSVSFLSSPCWSLDQTADIGIITGSDLDYVQSQSLVIPQNHSIQHYLLVLFCNDGGMGWI